MEVRKILVVRTSALGDVVHVLPALAALRERYPAASIDWLVEPGGAQLLRGHPLIRRLFVFDRPRWKREWRRPASWPRLLAEMGRLIAQVRAERFDLVVDFQCNVRSGLSVLLSGGRERWGFARSDAPEWGGRLFTNRKAPPCPRGIHKVEKNLWLVRALGWEGESPAPEIAIPEEDRAWARQVISTVPGNGPLVLVHPAVSRFGGIKRWTADRFRELVDLAQSELDARTLITWGPGERESAEAIGRPTVAPPIESPQRLAALAFSAAAVVAADTGALHIASAVGTPTVGIYGPKDPRVYGPYPPSARNRIVRSGVACSPCRLRRCEHRICMSLVFPEDVLAALREALAVETARL
jgi:lipopolysaccharide heptosyltransferase I